jgi:hypothetical protein
MADKPDATSISTGTSSAVTSSSSSPAPRSKVFTAWLKSRGGVTETERRRIDLVGALVRYVHANGGHVISPPGAKHVRIEIPKDSTLPIKLAEDFNYHPIQCGTNMRVTNEGFVQTDLIEITID